MNSVLRFSIFSVLWSKIRSFGFLFIRSSGFGLPYQFGLLVCMFTYFNKKKLSRTDLCSADYSRTDRLTSKAHQTNSIILTRYNFISITEPFISTFKEREMRVVISPSLACWFTLYLDLKITFGPKNNWHS